jgi:hypothetical protein
MAEYRHQRDIDAPPLRLPRVASLVLTTALGLGAGCLVLNRLLADESWQPKLARFETVTREVEQSKDRIDLLFFGPSHMMTDIDPEVFDAEAAKRGVPVHSYNYSVEGLRVSERDYLLRKLQAIQPPKLKYVLVKPDIWLHTDLENAFSTRARRFNDIEHTWRDLRVRMGSSQPLVPYRLGTATLILLGGAAHLANLGTVAEAILPPKQFGLEGTTERPERRGYVPLVRPDRSFSPFTDDDPYPRGEALPARELAPAEIQVLKELFDGIAQLGARPIALIPPVGNANFAETEETLAALRAHFPDVPVLSYHESPEMYAKLAYWEDMDHLSVAGARVFSELLAQDFARLAKGATE